MDRDEFFRALAEALDVEKIGAEDVLRDLDDWDSLAVLSVLAMADSNYGATVTPEDIRSVVTAGDLAAVVEKRRK